MVGKLHELLAVESNLANTAKAMMEEVKTTFAKKPEHFKGIVRAVKFFDEARSGENVTEEKAMVDTVTDRLSYALKSLARYYDALLQKEATNQDAKADLEVAGVPILKDAPATFLLGLETRLVALRPVLEAIPTLDPNIKWEEAADLDVDAWRSPVSATFKTEKQVKSKTLYDATKEHPAQIEKWYEDIPIAKVETTLTASMWTVARKAAILERLDTLLVAVKKARQRANSVEVKKVEAGKAMMEYLLG